MKCRHKSEKLGVLNNVVYLVKQEKAYKILDTSKVSLLLCKWWIGIIEIQRNIHVLAVSLLFAFSFVQLKKKRMSVLCKILVCSTLRSIYIFFYRYDQVGTLTKRYKFWKYILIYLCAMIVTVMTLSWLPEWKYCHSHKNCNVMAEENFRQNIDTMTKLNVLIRHKVSWEISFR